VAYKQKYNKFNFPYGHRSPKKKLFDEHQARIDSNLDRLSEKADEMKDASPMRPGYYNTEYDASKVDISTQYASSSPFFSRPTKRTSDMLSGYNKGLQGEHASMLTRSGKELGGVITGAAKVALGAL